MEGPWWFLDDAFFEPSCKESRAELEPPRPPPSRGVLHAPRMGVRGDKLRVAMLMQGASKSCCTNAGAAA